jgi:hypothetical protein
MPLLGEPAMVVEYEHVENSGQDQHADPWILPEISVPKFTEGIFEATHLVRDNLLHHWLFICELWHKG